MPGRLGALLLTFGALCACRPMIYDIDRIAGPVLKARYSCQYLLERSLATERQKDPDEVLRRRIADFREPAVVQAGDRVHIDWPEGAITRRADGSRHSGGCVMTLRPQGRHVERLTLDGRELHAGFGM